MSRPKKDIPPKKEHQITIRLTDDLFDAITADAKAAHLPRTEYIRKLITDNKLKLSQILELYNKPCSIADLGLSPPSNHYILAIDL